MLNIRRPLGRLIFNMGIAIPGKTVFLIETAPCLNYTIANWHLDTNTCFSIYCRCQEFWIQLHTLLLSHPIFSHNHPLAVMCNSDTFQTPHIFIVLPKFSHNHPLVVLCNARYISKHIIYFLKVFDKISSQVHAAFLVISYRCHNEEMWLHC